MYLTIVPVLLYASPVIFSAPEYFRVGIERIYHSALRTSLGLPRQTPLKVLQTISGRYEIGMQIHSSLIQCLLKHLALYSDSPLESLLKNRDALDYYRWGNSNVPAMYLLNSHVRSGMLNLSSVRRHPFYAPTYLYRSYEVIVNSLPFQSKNLPPGYINSVFFEYLQSLPQNTTLVGTDAAYRNNKGAIGISSNMGTPIAYRIHESFSIFSAEALAIIVALSLLASSATSLILFSDSLSVLSALEKVHRNSHSMILEIHQCLTNLVAQGKSIQLVWVPGHSGIPLNEKADQAAVGALASEFSSDFNIPWLDVYKSFNHSLLQHQQESWNMSPYSRRYPHLHPHCVWKAPVGFPRRAEISLQRLRSDTLPLNANLFRWKMIPSPHCSNCGIPEDTTHYLLACPIYAKQRKYLLEALHLPPQTQLHDLLDFGDKNSCSLRTWELWKFISNTHRFT